VRLRLFILGALACLLAPAWTQAEMLVYFGTYTRGKSAGIYVSRLDAASGALAPPELAVEAVNPSFLAVHPTGRFLYSVNEVEEGQASAFVIEATARLRLLNQSSSEGAGPCYLSLDRTGRHLFVANYGGGSVTVIPVGPDGALGPATDSVKHPGSKARAHSIDVDSANQFAVAADLGLDRVFVYSFDAVRGALGRDPAFVSLEPGAGPRHVAFHPEGRFAWVLNELALTLTTLRYEPERGGLEAAGTVSSLPDDTAVSKEFSGAEVMVHPDGRFLYASNRGHDTIAVFAIDEKAGALRRIEHVSTGGKRPRGFGIDPSGQYLLAANQDSDNVVVFRIDRATGRLTATGHTVEVGSPVALAFVTAGPLSPRAE
jgi:6-phosphogluconolactonase